MLRSGLTKLSSLRSPSTNKYLLFITFLMLKLVVHKSYRVACYTSAVLYPNTYNVIRHEIMCPRGSLWLCVDNAKAPDSTNCITAMNESQDTSIVLTCIPRRADTPMYKKTPYRTGIGIYWNKSQHRDYRLTVNEFKISELYCLVSVQICVCICVGQLMWDKIATAKLPNQ